MQVHVDSRDSTISRIGTHVTCAQVSSKLPPSTADLPKNNLLSCQDLLLLPFVRAKSYLSGLSRWSSRCNQLDFSSHHGYLSSSVSISISLCWNADGRIFCSHLLSCLVSQVLLKARSPWPLAIWARPSLTRALILLAFGLSVLIKSPLSYVNEWKRKKNLHTSRPFGIIATSCTSINLSPWCVFLGCVFKAFPFPYNIKSSAMLSMEYENWFCLLTLTVESSSESHVWWWKPATASLCTSVAVLLSWPKNLFSNSQQWVQTESHMNQG